MKRLVTSALVLGLALALTSTASAHGIRGRIGIRHTPIHHHQVVRHVPIRVAPVCFCYQVHYSLNHWHCRTFHCEIDARRFSDYLCNLGFQTQIAFSGGCFNVHYFLPTCLTKSFNHRCDADAFAALLCRYGIHTNVVVVRH